MEEPLKKFSCQWTKDSNPLVNAYNTIRMFEQELGQRFCIRCKAMLPSSSFPPGQQQTPQHFVCTAHPLDIMKTKPRIRTDARIKSDRSEPLVKKPKTSAVQFLRTRARRDTRLFGQTTSELSLKHLKKMLSKEQEEHFENFAVVPIRANEPLSAQNAVIITVSQRRWLTGLWKQKRDQALYARDLKLLQESWGAADGDHPPGLII